jgi:hypothetical protein
MGAAREVRRIDAAALAILGGFSCGWTGVGWCPFMGLGSFGKSVFRGRRRAWGAKDAGCDSDDDCNILKQQQELVPGNCVGRPGRLRRRRLAGVEAIVVRLRRPVDFMQLSKIGGAANG